ncbi:MAG: MipA/OmpV family protein [Rhizobiaceae bacterium]|nr:MipA/OmpV family protein [Rhizobiaceae bacterium]
MYVKLFLNSLAGLVGLSAAVLAADYAQAEGAGSGPLGWIKGDWYLTVGASGFVAPDFDGAKSHVFTGIPMISLGKAGPEARFTSRNDNISISLMDTGPFRAGVNGKVIFGRDSDDAVATEGLDDVRFGGELGGFAEVYPTDWLRVRGEVRHGIRSHDGVVAELKADAFADITDAIRISAGPRLSAATSGYFDAYYGVDAEEAVNSGLSEYEPGSGLRSLGFGGAVTWKATDKVTTGVFAEYWRLQGPAADSSLVEERGSRDQYTIGAWATYRFDFSM